MRHMGLALFLHLAFDELDDIRVIDIQITIFAARALFPPLLITPAKASKPFMKLTGPDAIPPPDSVSLLPRSVEKFVPVPEAPLEEHSFSARQPHDHSSCRYRIDEARRALRFSIARPRLTTPAN